MPNAVDWDTCGKLESSSYIKAHRLSDAGPQVKCRPRRLQDFNRAEHAQTSTFDHDSLKQLPSRQMASEFPSIGAMLWHMLCFPVIHSAPGLSPPGAEVLMRGRENSIHRR
jgi:hypothetical protein